MSGSLALPREMDPVVFFKRSSSWSVARSASKQLAALTQFKTTPSRNYHSAQHHASPSSSIKAADDADDYNCQGGPNAVLDDLIHVAIKKKGVKYDLDLCGVLAKEHVECTTVLPASLAEFTWLTHLDVSRNRLATLPDCLGDLVNLTSLDVSENELISLPSTIGKLNALVTLSIEKNKIEELPWGIGQCKSLTKLNGDFNQLKALPEVVGNLGKLKSLSVHLNCLKSLPRTMATMTSLVELDVRFNHLEAIPESLCLVTTLVRLNLASNFSDLKELPQSLGRLKKLKELDVSFNHLTSLPDSFAMLTNLQALNLEGNPLKLPPLHIAGQGKEVVLSYMIKHVERERISMRKRSRFAKLAYKTLRMLRRRNGRVNGDLHILA